ncbi:hypothetical protein [Aliishimia ponticola]|nr:hypothetical protein [Aliishimia ponticola]
MKRMVFALLILVSGCAQFPELDSAIPAEAEAAAYPDLVPLNGSFDPAAPIAAQEQTEAGLSARLARLQARAARLRGRVIDSGTRARMAKGVAPIPEQG